MNRSFRTRVGLLLLVGLVVAAFSSGKAIGLRLRHRDSGISPWLPGSNSDIDDRSEPNASPDEVFASVLEKVQHDFVGGTGTATVSNARLTEGALGRMVASLKDPHAVYLNPAQTEQRIDSILGRRFGIGAEFTIVTRQSKTDDLNSSFLTVKSVGLGSPAERSGLHSGDHITELDGQWIIAYPVPSEAGRQPDQTSDIKQDDSKRVLASQIKPGITAARAIQVLSTGTGKSFRITVDGVGRKTPEQIVISTGQTVMPAVVNRSEANGVTYLRIAEFNAEVAAAIDSVLGKRQDWAVGLIIDLRQNAGGVEAERGSQLDGYHSALDLIGCVAQKSAVGQLERKPGVRTPIIAATVRLSQNHHARVAVLIDGGTSNIAEMAAAGMRDAGGAKLIGSHTFGDDVLPYFSVLKNGGGVEIASAHLFTSSGDDLLKGVKPDIPVDTASAVGGKADPVLRRALRFVSGQ